MNALSIRAKGERRNLSNKSLDIIDTTRQITDNSINGHYIELIELKVSRYIKDLNIRIQIFKFSALN